MNKTSSKKKMTKKQKYAAVYYLIPLIAVLVFQLSGIGASLADGLNDAVYQQSKRIDDSGIYVIGIDEDTLSEYGQFENWSRSKTAELINLLCADEKYKPRVIALDIGFYSEKDGEADAALVEAVKNAGNVVLVSSATFGTQVSDDGKSYVNGIAVYEEPFEALKAVAAGVGHSNVEFDDDGIVRHAFGSLNYNGQKINSFAYEIFKLAGGGDSGDFGAQSSKFYIDYSGMPRDYFGSGITGYSLCKVLDGSIKPNAFADSVVLVGAFASGMQDNYYSAIDKSEQMYGVEIHANILNQLMRGKNVTEAGTGTSVAIMLCIALISAALLFFIDTKISVPASVVLGAAYFFACKFLYSGKSLLLDLLYPLLAVLLMIACHIIVRYFTVHREKKRIIASYGKYLSPEVAATIADTGEEALKLGGTKKDIAVLFVDIRSFTTLSESMLPEKVVEMLNSYLAITTKSIFDQKGTVDKFIGDATMGVFNAPLDLDDYTFRAVCAGLEMAELSKGLDANLAPELRGRVGFGVGINCGDAVVGNIGTGFRMEYTAIGDTVNTASRLEGQAKAGCVVISDKVYERVKDRIECEDLGKVSLKGKAEPVQIWRALYVKGGNPF